MTAKFEDRHLELRETLAQRGAAWREGEEDGAEVIAASRRLDAFHECTGRLVDELTAAVRSYAVESSLGARQVDARMVMFAALAALDEEAARG